MRLRERHCDLSSIIDKELRDRTKCPILEDHDAGRSANSGKLNPQYFERQMFAKTGHRNWKHDQEASAGQEMMTQRNRKGHHPGVRGLQAAFTERFRDGGPNYAVGRWQDPRFVD